MLTIFLPVMAETVRSVPMILAANHSPDAILRRMYASTSRAMDGTPRQRSMAIQQLVDDSMTDVGRLIRLGTPDLLDLLLSDMSVDRVHPEVLDVILALIEDMVLPSIRGFKDRVSGRLEKVDEILRPIVLRRGYGGQDHHGRPIEAEVISHDVRKDARALYRAKAIAFGDALRKDGNLDRFYRTDAMRKRARK